MKTKAFEDLVLAICEDPAKCSVDWNYNSMEVTVFCAPPDAKRLVGKAGASVRSLMVTLNALDRRWTLNRIQSDGVYTDRFTAGEDDGDAGEFIQDILGNLLDAIFGDCRIEIGRLDGTLRVTGYVRSNMPEYRLSKLSDALRILFVPIGVHFNEVVHVQLCDERAVSRSQPRTR